MSDLDSIEFADNPDPRCPCVLLLDTSTSMQGAPIAALNEGLKIFQNDINEDDLAQRRTEIAVITFGNGGVEFLNHANKQMQSVADADEHSRPFITADEFEPPTLVAGGLTPMGQAIDAGLDLLQERKRQYKENGIAYYRPWIFLVSDGEPNDAWDDAVERVHMEVQYGGLAFFVVGVEPRANMEMLSVIASPQQPPVKLTNLKFSEMFVWLSRSQQRVSRSKIGEQIPTLPVSGWELV